MTVREQIEATHDGAIIGCNHAGGHCGVWVKVAPVIEHLEAQLQAAQATIAEAQTCIEQSDQGDSFGPIDEILSRADTSALAAVKAEALRDAAYDWEEAPDRTPRTGADAGPWLRTRAASIEQERADRGHDIY